VKVDRGDHFNGLEEAIAAQLPKVYALKQNYPNPFNPTTNIRFDLPKDSDVSLVVYDLMGREVAKLVNGPMNAGYYTINFNAANLPSGVYIYRLKAGDFVNTKKLMLLK
ncbi:MAG TPA: T9SS type A sorting domain-containing protein, partial [Candidatus Marinimicrobia bacterium]|nr:T9SS type A sorting domain-containing protein [Candidatus Neomarinimicrobiota bacterium]